MMARRSLQTTDGIVGMRHQSSFSPNSIVPTCEPLFLRWVVIQTIISCAACTWRLRQINTQENQIQQAHTTIKNMKGQVDHMRGKVEEALKLLEVANKLEERIVNIQHRQGSEEVYHGKRS